MDTIAICAIQKDEAPYLLEWIAFHLNAGVDHIRLYDNDSTDDSPAILAAIAAKYPVSVVRHPTVAGQSPQITAYTDALGWLRGRAEFVAFIDLDEFLFGADDRLLRDLVRAMPADISAIGINQRIFGSSDEIAYRPDLVTSRFARREPALAKGCHFFKSIARVRRIARPGVHNVAINSGRYVFSDGSPLEASKEHAGKATRIVRGPIRLHHYVTKSEAEFAVKRARGGAASEQERWRKSRYSEESFALINRVANRESDVSLSALAGRTRSKMREIFDIIRGDLPASALDLYLPLVR